MPFRLRTLPLLLLLALPGGLAAATPAAAAVSDEIIVQRRPALDAAERTRLRAEADVQLKTLMVAADAEVVVADAGERSAALEALRADPDVLWAEPNRPRRAFTSDQYWTKLWGLENTGQSVLGVAGTADADTDAPDGWRAGKGAGALVAVADTGAQPDHPDLTLVPGRDFIDRDLTPTDGNGHGTHVTGTIAARENTIGVVGIAPAADVMALRVLDDDGYGSSAGVTGAFAYAGQMGVRVVNASLGSSSYSRAEYEAIRDSPNTLFVVAAGNDGVSTDVEPSYPCNYPLANIVCVGASDQRDAQAWFSNYGTLHVDLHAPGESILSTYPGSRYAWLDGTSMATPHVAGAAAVLAAADPALSTAEIKQALLDGADRIPALTGRSVTGARLNLDGALAVLTPPEPEPQPEPEPAPAPAPPGDVRAPEPQQPVPAAPAAPAPAPALAPAVTLPPPAVAVPRERPARVSRLRLSGKPRICASGCRSRSGRLTFTLSEPAKVTIALQRRSCTGTRCRYRAAGRTRLQLAAGAHRFTVRKRLATLPLRAGQWRVRISTSADAAARSFRIAAR